MYYMADRWGLDGTAAGREMNALMREKHREAALHIFAARNPSPSRVYKEVGRRHR